MIPGVTKSNSGMEEISWNILGQTYVPKLKSENSMAWHATLPKGTFVPPHIHPTQDEFILVQEGELDLKLDGVWTKARAGDLVRMPRGIPHGYFNKSDKPCRALFWVSPMGQLRDLFEALHDQTDIPRIVELSAQHEVEFLPEEANA